MTEFTTRNISPGRGYLYSLAAAIFSGLCIGIGKVILTDSDTMTMVVGLFVYAVPINFVWWWINRDSDRTEKLNYKIIPLISLQALLSVTAIFLLWYGIKLIDPTVGAFFSRFEVLVVLILGVWLFKDRFKLQEGIGAIIILTGLFVLRYKAGIEVSTGMTIILSSATVFGISELVAKRIVRSTDPNIFALFRNCHILVYIASAAVITGKLDYSLLGKYHYLVPIAAFLGPGLGRPMYLHALKNLEVSKVATVNQLQPVAVAIVAYFALGLLPEIKEWFGGLIIVSGCIIMVRGR